MKLKAHELDDGEIVYGKVGDRNGAEVLEVWDVTPRGKPYPTGETVFLVRDWSVRAHDLRDAIMWDGGPVGIAEAFYPHPKGWRLQGAKEGSNLEGMTVRVLTALFRQPHEQEPTCYSTWPSKCKGCDMHTIAARLTSPLITPRDFKSYYRILNRNLYTRNISIGPHALCRLCDKSPERFSHIGECPIILATFQPLQALAGKYVKDVPLDERLIYLGMAGARVLPGPLSDLHIILWKFVMISFTRKDTCNEDFKPARIWKDTVRRFRARLMAYKEKVRRHRLKWLVSKQREALPTTILANLNKHLKPCAEVSEVGFITWSQPLTELMGTMKLPLEAPTKPTNPWKFKPIRRIWVSKRAPRGPQP